MADYSADTISWLDMDESSDDKPTDQIDTGLQPSE